MAQLRFESMRDLKPPRPTVQDEAIAQEIAKHIIEAVNLDEFYWEGDDVTAKIDQVRDDIMLNGEPEMVFIRLAKKEPPADCRGRKSEKRLLYEHLFEHSEQIAKAIVAEVMEAAEKRFDERYS